jgi:hypothetical protein
VITAITAVLSQAAPALAASPPPPASSGYDISWPQCGSPYPSGGAFGIVGVTNGRAWSTNSCLLSEYQWAAGYPRTPDLYMNTANPAPHSSYYWPASGARDPALCKDATVTTDPGCAYDYGWHTAANALATSRSVLGSRAQGVWWLDVETGNTWNGDGSSNAADLQGSIDYLLAQKVAGVGVYSTQYQWSTLTGGYSTSNYASYAAAWQPEFTSPNGLKGVASWVAGANGPSDAPGYCSSSFLGTTTWLVQYISGGFDVDYACPVGPDYSVTSPSTVSARAGTSVTSTITLRSFNGWSGTMTLTVSAPPGVTATLSSSTVTLAANGSASVRLTLRDSTVGSYRVTITAHPQSGSTSTGVHATSETFSVKRLPDWMY